MNVMGDVIFDTLRKREGRSCRPDNVLGFFPELQSPSAGYPVLPVSNVVCLHRTRGYHNSNRSKLHYDIYFCLGGPLYIVELSDSDVKRKAPQRSSFGQQKEFC